MHTRFFGGPWRASQGCIEGVPKDAKMAPSKGWFWEAFFEAVLGPLGTASRGGSIFGGALKNSLRFHNEYNFEISEALWKFVRQAKSGSSRAEKRSLWRVQSGSQNGLEIELANWRQI